jgi:hypothetical protein
MWNFAFNKVTFCVCRFVGFYTAIFWAVQAVPLYRALRNQSLPQDIPHRHEIYIAQGSSAVVVSVRRGLFHINMNVLANHLTPKSVIICVWNWFGLFWITIGSMKKKGNKLIVFCIIDLGIVGLGLASLALQSHYLSRSYNGCKNVTNWQLNRKYVGMFLLLADNPNSKSAGKKCHDFVEAWVLQIVTL